jgi:hypothetical protein
MNKKLSALFSRFFGDSHTPTPFERRLAKIFVKRRLLALNPSFRGNPAALEQAYQDLDILITEEVGDNGAIAYELKVPSGFPANPS